VEAGNAKREEKKTEKKKKKKREEIRIKEPRGALAIVSQSGIARG